MQKSVQNCVISVQKKLDPQLRRGTAPPHTLPFALLTTPLPPLFSKLRRHCEQPLTQFQGHDILWRWIFQKWYKIQTKFQQNTNRPRDLHTPYSTMSFRMTLSDLIQWHKASRGLSATLTRERIHNIFWAIRQTSGYGSGLIRIPILDHILALAGMGSRSD